MLSDETGSVKDKVSKLAGVGGVVEKINKSEFDLYKAQSATKASGLKLKGTVLAVNGTSAEYIVDMKTKISRSALEHGINFFIIPILYRVDVNTSTDIYVYGGTSDDVAYELVDYIQATFPNVTIAINCYLTAMDGNGVSFTPTSIATWFANWKTIVVNNAIRCETKGVQYLGIDNENKNLTTITYKDYWIDIIDTIHSHNVLVFNSSNYSEWLTSCMADLVDIIGFNFYPSLTLNGLNETDLEMKRALYNDLYGVNWILKIIDLAQYDKPIWLTEIGCSANIKALESTGTTYSWSGLGYASYQAYVDAECDLNIPAFYMEYILGFIGNLKSVNGIALFALNGLEPDWSFLDNPSGVIVKKYWVEGA